MKEFLQIILLILGFTAVLFVAYFMTRFIGAKMSYSNATSHIKIMDRVFLSNDKSICIIQVGKRFFVVGVTNHHIDPICELKESDLLPIATEENNSFNNLVESYISKFRHRSKGNDQHVDRIQQIKDSLDSRKGHMKKNVDEGNNWG